LILNQQNRFWIAGSVLLAASLLAASCSGQNKAKPADNGLAEEKKEPVELVVYHAYPADWPAEVFAATFAEPIQKKFPHMTIKYLNGNIEQLITAGEKIDILYVSIGNTPSQLIDTGLQYDIEPLIKKHEFDLNRLEPAMVDAGRQVAGGKGIYGLPVLVPPSAVYYNKDLFDKFGVAYPKDGQTWDDLYETSKKMTRIDGGIQYYGFGSSYNHLIAVEPVVDPARRRKPSGHTGQRRPLEAVCRQLDAVLQASRL